MNKKLLILTLCVIAICAVIAGITFASTTEFANAESISVEYNQNNSKSIAIYKDAIIPYKNVTKNCNGEEVVTYSEDFAGVFIDDEGFLTIGLTDLQKSGSTYDGQVKYKTCDFTYNYLESIKKEIIISNIYYSIYRMNISDMHNYLRIYLTDENDIEIITNFLRQRIKYDERAIKFIVESDGGIVLTSTAYGGEAIYSRTSSTTVEPGRIWVNAIDNITGKFGDFADEPSYICL